MVPYDCGKSGQVRSGSMLSTHMQANTAEVLHCKHAYGGVAQLVTSQRFLGPRL